MDSTEKIANQLQKLSKLHSEGELTDEEFRALKATLISDPAIDPISTPGVGAAKVAQPKQANSGGAAVATVGVIVAAALGIWAFWAANSSPQSVCGGSETIQTVKNIAAKTDMLSNSLLLSLYGSLPDISADASVSQVPDDHNVNMKMGGFTSASSSAACTAH
jgi:hypothetical protein